MYQPVLSFLIKQEPLKHCFMDCQLDILLDLAFRANRAKYCLVY